MRNEDFNRWMDRRWWKIALSLAALGYGFWHPGIRPILFLILPLGRQWDDILVGVPLILAGVIFVFKMFKRRAV